MEIFCYDFRRDVYTNVAGGTYAGEDIRDFYKGDLGPIPHPWENRNLSWDEIQQLLRIADVKLAVTLRSILYVDVLAHYVEIDTLREISMWLLGHQGKGTYTSVSDRFHSKDTRWRIRAAAAVYNLIGERQAPTTGGWKGLSKLPLRYSLSPRVTSLKEYITGGAAGKRCGSDILVRTVGELIEQWETLGWRDMGISLMNTLQPYAKWMS